VELSFSLQKRQSAPLAIPARVGAAMVTQRRKFTNSLGVVWGEKAVQALSEINPADVCRRREPVFAGSGIAAKPGAGPAAITLADREIQQINFCKMAWGQACMPIGVLLLEHFKRRIRS